MGVESSAVLGAAPDLLFWRERLPRTILIHMRRLAAIVVLAVLAFAALALAEERPPHADAGGPIRFPKPRGTASGSWSAGNLDCCAIPTQYAMSYAKIFDLPSGDLGVLAVARTGSSNGYAVQRVSRDGGIAPGWPVGGVALSPLAALHTPRVQSFASDGDGYIWRTFAASGGREALAQYVTPGGVLAPTTYPNYYVVGSAAFEMVHAAPLPNGDVYVTRDGSRINRIQRNGNPGFGWTSTGRSLPGSSMDDNAILPDGNGGAIVFMRNNGVGLVTRIDSTKAVHAGWPPDGLPLTNLPGGGIGEDSFLIPSGTDQFLAAWSYPDPSGSRGVVMQRFGLDGTVDPAWPENGLEVVAPTTLWSLTIIGDGQGGAYALHHIPYVAPVASHISPAGTFVGGRDVSVLGPDAQYAPPSSAPYALAADHTPGGGLVVTYNDDRLAMPSFRVRWLLPDLTADPQMSDSGVVFIPGTPGTDLNSMLAIHADGDRSVFVAWGGHPSGADLWMARVTAPVSPPVAVPGASYSGVDLGFTSAPAPNPSPRGVTFGFALQRAGHARAEVLDTSGRCIAVALDRDFDAGRQTGSWDGRVRGGARAQPGIYHVRLSLPGYVAVRPVVIAR